MRAPSFPCLALLLVLACPLLWAAPEPIRPGEWDVRDFGAAADGESDCTAAFQRALDTAGESGGGVVHVPAGRYFFKGVLTMPDYTTLEGVWRAPVRGEQMQKGSILLVTSGKGDADGVPFLRMGGSTVIKGLTIFYPEQIRANPPLPYPWTVQSSGYNDNLTILDVTMVNPYQAVDFGSYAAGRHLVRNLYAYPLYKGLYVNQCYDVGRLENIHFWPFWDIDPNSPLWEFTRENATAFIIGKTDGEMANGLFCIFYNVSMHFIAGPIYDEDRNITAYRAGSGMYTNCYLDVTPTAVLADAVMDTAGVSFVNGSIMSRIVVGPKNQGPVKFTGCGFWATGDLKSHAELEGHGTVFFNSCHFNDWDRAGKGAPCIDANNRRLIVTGSDFPTRREDHQLIALGPRVRSAVITSNTMPGGKHIVNNAPPMADIQIASNAAEPPGNFLRECLVLGPFPNPEKDGGHVGYETDYLGALGGEPDARITAATTVDHENGGQTQPAQTKALRINHRDTLDFHRLFNGSNQVAYAFFYLHSDKKQNAFFDAGMNDSGKVYVNGRLVYERYSPLGQACKPGFDYFEAALEKGPNPVLVKIADSGGKHWEFMLEAYGEDGSPLEASLEK